LFQYYDDRGKRRDVNSEDVNDYLREISGEDFTAKDFRTWAGTVLGATQLFEAKPFTSHAAAKRNIGQSIAAVAQRLGNTPAVCRKCYIHPEIINAYLDGTLSNSLKRRPSGRPPPSLKKLRAEEAAVLALLRQRLTLEKRGQSKEHLRSQLRRSIAKLAAHDSRG
jgi:DNA topoisomerase-1